MAEVYVSDAFGTAASRARIYGGRRGVCCPQLPAS